MPALEYAEGAVEDLRSLVAFLAPEGPEAAAETAALVMQALEILRAHPLIGRHTRLQRHELIISRGRTGYIAVYEFDPFRDRVLVLAIRHQREAGFEE